MLVYIGAASRLARLELRVLCTCIAMSSVYSSNAHNRPHDGGLRAEQKTAEMETEGMGTGKTAKHS